MHAAAPFDADKYERLLFRAEFSGGPRYGEIWEDMGRYVEIWGPSPRTCREAGSV